MIDVHAVTDKISLISADVRAATYYGPDNDITNLIGRGSMILDAEAQGNGITNTVKLQSSPHLATGYAQITAGENEIPLRHGAADNVKLAASWTQSGARSIKTVTLRLKRAGAIAAEKAISISIQADNAGDPSGTALGTSASIDPLTVSTAAYVDVTFTFAEPVNVADATKYHVVLEGTYDASGTVRILWRALTVASGGNASLFDAAWAADDTKSFELYAMQYQFSDVTGAAFTAVGNAAAFQTKAVALDGVSNIVRAVATIAGGNSTGAYSCILIGRKQVSS